MTIKFIVGIIIIISIIICIISQNLLVKHRNILIISSILIFLGILYIFLYQHKSSYIPIGDYNFYQDLVINTKPVENCSLLIRIVPSINMFFWKLMLKTLFVNGLR